MLFYTLGQSYAFLGMMAAGLVLGAWYALVGGLRRLTEAGDILTIVLDAVFAAGATGIVAAGLLFTTRMEMRLYALAGALLGMALFLWGVMPILRYIWRMGASLRTNVNNMKILKILSK